MSCIIVDFQVTEILCMPRCLNAWRETPVNANWLSSLLGSLEDPRCCEPDDCVSPQAASVLLGVPTLLLITKMKIKTANQIKT
jgi:hypothetical protein